MVVHHEWNKDRIEELRLRWERGETCSEISRAMPGTTRSAVIGKVHRLGLPSRPHPIRSKLPKVKTLPIMKFDPTPTAEPLHIRMLNLTSKHCRFPYGEGANITFCGLAPKAGQPYCPDCCTRVYQPKHPPKTTEE